MPLSFCPFSSPHPCVLESRPLPPASMLLLPRCATPRANLWHLCVRCNRAVHLWTFVLSETRCHCPNAYFDGCTIFVRNKRAFILSGAIISGSNCICMQPMRKPTEPYERVLFKPKFSSVNASFICCELAVGTALYPREEFTIRVLTFHDSAKQRGGYRTFFEIQSL